MKNVEDLKTYFEKVFYQKSSRFEFLEIGDGTSLVKLSPSLEDLRPGNTVSGPVLMEVADAALYVAVLYKTNLAKMAVTSNLNINFLKKPDASQNILAECRVLKLGRKSAFGEVMLYSELSRELVAHATGTYVI